MIAREYNILAVVGTKIATAALKDGDIVTVDGTEGVVRIEKRK
ncbi:phosphohistidine swiveling domain-containing protein [Scopulibacillus daqui]|uniref:Phosphohistidine swiveling domain-containing protein n=1 Tax=Scopulibacillus daqui TaxID=1469162 RepID=A0ABS2Q3U9_9BACL|nr:phosphohistidine swiveling domain-containing protein [Scopulibacillus daqui]